MKSFVDYSSNSDFSIHNIPFGVAVFNKEYIGCCTRIGDQVIDLATLYDLGYFEDIEGWMTMFLKPIRSMNLSSWVNLLPMPCVPKFKLLQEGSILSKDQKTIEEAFYDLDKVK
jgi:fumarylacetoacetase